jgi:hypothetical protein
MTNALALPEATTRRGVLRAMLVASAVGAIPVAAEAATAAKPVSGPAGLDAGLFALVDEVPEAGARVEAAIVALEEAQERTEKAPWPQALIVTEADTPICKLKAGDPFDLDHHPSDEGSASASTEFEVQRSVDCRRRRRALGCNAER